MKILTYKIEGYTNVLNPETGEIEKQLSLATMVVENPTAKEIAKAEEIAYNGECTIEDDGQPEPVPSGDPVTWDELDAAYTAGYEEGYAEGVNGLYGNE